MDLEEQLGFNLFVRDKKRLVELTEGGRTFVAEARSALLHTERAVQLGRAAHGGADTILNVGHSPYADPAWVSTIFSIRLPLYPRLKIHLTSNFALELARCVVAGELDFALVTAPPQDPQLSAMPFAYAPLCAVLLDSHEAADKEQLELEDLAQDEWIIYGKRVHPVLHEAIMKAMQRDAITPRAVHHVISAQHALQLVSDDIGVAVIKKPSMVERPPHRLVIKPIADASLRFETCVATRKSDSSRLVKEFTASFLRAQQSQPPKQLKLPMSVPDFSIRRRSGRAE